MNGPDSAGPTNGGIMKTKTENNRKLRQFILSNLIILLSLIFTQTLVAADDSAIVPQPAGRIMDFDGDGKADLVVVRDNASAKLDWYLNKSGGGYLAQQFGINNDWLVPEDYDGDGKSDIAIWRQGDYYNPQGYYYIFNSTNNTVSIVAWGLWLDTPEKTQDFDGDGKADPTVVRFVPGGNLVWYILQSNTGQMRVEAFGSQSSDGPIRGDFDGDGKADLAVRRCSGTANTFIYKQSSNNQTQYTPFGLCGSGGDVTVAGDFDGDGKSDVAVYRWSTSVWYWRRSSDGQVGSIKFGNNPSGDLPAPADYDGDGKTDQAVWRGTNGVFYINGSSSGFSAVRWGISGDHVAAFELLTH